MNTNRLMKVLKWNFIANKRQLVRNTIAYASVLLVLVILMTRVFWRGGNEIDPGEMYQIANVVTIISMIGMTVAVARLNWNMQKKNDIINYLMLPATKLEKYLANFIFQTVVVFCSAVVGILLADVVQMVISLLVTHSITSLSMAMLYTIKDFVWRATTYDVFASIFAILLFHSFYAFGGTFFRRYNILLTTASLIAIPLVLASVFGLIGAGIVHWLDSNGMTLTIEWLIGETGLAIISYAVSIAFIALFYWGSYHFFCRTQVINNLFRN